MKRRGVILSAVLTLTPAFSASAETQWGICQHETGCPFGGIRGYTVVWVPCGADIEGKAREMCTVVTNGQRTVRPYNRVLVNGPISGGRCGAAEWKVTCLDQQ